MEIDIKIRGSDKWVAFMSITKLFVAFLVHYLVDRQEISYSDQVIKYFPAYQHPDVTILHILQHKTGLYSDWSASQEYCHSPYHRKIAFELQKVGELGVFEYNNYAYDILCDIIEKVTNTKVDRLIGKLFFDKYRIKYVWYGNYGGYGLAIKVCDAPKMAYLLDFLHKINYQHMLEHDLIGDFQGHTGSGGQFLYFNLAKNRFLFWAHTGNEPFADPFSMDDVRDKIEKIGSK